MAKAWGQACAARWGHGMQWRVGMPHVVHMRGSAGLEVPRAVPALRAIPLLHPALGARGCKCG